MADIVMDGNVKVAWVTTISNTSAPTSSELNAGVDLTSWITPDGLNITTETADVDTTAVNSTQNTYAVGRRTDSASLTFKHQGFAAAPWTTFASNPSGYVVVRRGIAGSTAWAASQKVLVYPAQAGYRALAPYAANEVEKFSVDFKINGIVVDSATTA